MAAPAPSAKAPAPRRLPLGNVRWLVGKELLGLWRNPKALHIVQAA